MSHRDPDADAANDAPAAPGPEAPQRRPGELGFTLILLIGSGILLWEAYGIAGFSQLSSPGAIPMAATGVMLVCLLVILWRTLRLPLNRSETLTGAIVPLPVVLVVGLLLGYALLLRPLGFLPTSFVFLTLAIRLLSRRSLLSSAGIAAFSVLLIWVLFRVVFTVLMPPGIVPEGQILQVLRDLIGGGR